MHSVQVTTKYPDLSRGIHTGALSGLVICGRIGNCSSSSAIVANNSSGEYWPLEKNASAIKPVGIVPLNSPESAITAICGNRLLTTDKSSKPLMFGILKSEMIMSGRERRRCASASKPSVAVKTSNPRSLNTRVETCKTPGSFPQPKSDNQNRKPRLQCLQHPIDLIHQHY